MTREEAADIESRLAEVVFSLIWHDEKGNLCNGTGFFIGADGIALTAFHNLSPELKRDPSDCQPGLFRGTEIAFHWVAQGEKGRAWQEKHDIAILRADPTPLGLKPVRCFFLPSHIRADRGSAWAGDEVAFLGHPAHLGFARNLMTGRVDRAMPLRDHNIQGNGGYHISDAIQIGVDFSGDLAGLRGMSGSPLYDLKYGGIVGLALAVSRQASATELCPVAEFWPHGKEVLRPLPITPPPAPVRRWLVLLVLLIGAVLWWYWRGPKPVPKRLVVDVLRLDSNRRETLNTKTGFNQGEKVRFLITPPMAGYLYVVDQELNLKGEPGQPELIFPTTKTGMGRNRVSAGVQIPFPAEDEDPPYIDPEPEAGGRNYGGELLTVLVYPNPLNIELQPGPIPVSPDQIPLKGLKPRIFRQPSAASENALAVQQIRVSVHASGQ